MTGDGACKLRWQMELDHKCWCWVTDIQAGEGGGELGRRQLRPRAGRKDQG